MIDPTKIEVIGEILLKPFKKDLFELAEDVIIKVHTVKSGVLTFHIKAGYKTDLGSIPKTLQNWFPFTGNK